MNDRRLKLIEVVLTLGGFLGVIVTLEQNQLPSGFSSGFIEIIVLYIVSGFVAYSSIAIPMRDGVIRLSLAAFSASFSALLTLALSIPLSNAAIDVAVLSKPALGVTGADIVYLGVFLIILYFFYYMIRSVMSVSFDRMEGEVTEPAQDMTEHT